MITPCLALVVQYRRSETPSRADPRPGDRNRPQVDGEHREPDRQWRHDLHRMQLRSVSGNTLVEEMQCGDW